MLNAQRAARRKPGPKWRHALAAGAIALSLTGAGVQIGGVPAQCAARNALPDSVCTPGTTNPNVTAGNVQTTICQSGFTAKIRPPVSYTNPLKLELMRRYGLTGQPADYELDHLISLELGGDPRSPANLWPEAYQPEPGAHAKDRVENYLKAQVCSGAMTLAAAQQQVSHDWLSVWKRITSLP